MYELFRTNVGSHMWKMNHPKSDIDIAICYLADSKDILLGKKIRGKQKQEGEYDYTYYELGHTIHHLLKGNVNFLWMLMSPIVISKKGNALDELKMLVCSNLSKNCYHSINGLSKHNIHHFIEKGDKYSLKYRKKLNVIGRTLRFGINLLTWQKFIFDKVDIKTEEGLWLLKNKLDEAYKNTTLPDKPNPESFEKYLIKWRIKKMRKDGLIK